MSVIRDLIKQVDNTDQKAAEIRENLKTLISLAEAKATIFEEQIQLDLKTGKTTDNLKVPITLTVTSQVQYRATSSDKTSDVFGELSSAIQDMISDSSASGIVKGVAKIAGSALNTIMGVGEGFEQTVKLYSVVTDYPAIVRFDFAFWARKIEAESMRKYCETALACVAYKSAVDVTKLAFNDFLSLYGPILNEGFGSDPAQMKEMIKQAKEVYSMYQTDSLAVPQIATENDLALVRSCKKPRSVVFSPAVKATTGNF